MIDPLSKNDIDQVVKVAIVKAREIFPREAQDALDKHYWGFDIMIRELILHGVGSIEQYSKDTNTTNENKRTD